MKNITSEMIISLDEVNNRLDNAGEKISELENITIKTIHSKYRNYMLSSECSHTINVFNGSYI